MIQAGTPVDESEVPLDNPARLRPIMNLSAVSSKYVSEFLKKWYDTNNFQFITIDLKIRN